MAEFKKLNRRKAEIFLTRKFKKLNIRPTGREEIEMKLTNTDFNMKVNESSSYIVYITKSKEVYDSIYRLEMKKRELLHDQLGWYYSIGGHAPIQQDCRVPEFFHGDNFLMVCVEHNNGDWNKQPTYKLYIAE